MKKFYLLMIAALLGLTLNNASAQVFQSGFETWTSVAPIKPTDWCGIKTSVLPDSAVQYTVAPHSGTNAIKLINHTTSHKRLTTCPVSITLGKTYTISYWVKGNGFLRSGLYDGGPSGNNYHYINDHYTTAYNTTTWVQVTESVIADTTSVNAEFILSFKSTSGADNLMVDDVNIVDSITDHITSIYDIQYTTNPNGDSPKKDSTLTTTGIVTGVDSTAYFIQDGTGPWNGLYIWDFNTHPTLGDSIVIKGKIIEYNGMTEISNPTSASIISSGHTVPDPITLNTTDVQNEQYESVLVYIDCALCTDDGTQGWWKVTSPAQNECEIGNLMFPFLGADTTKAYNVTGNVYFSFGFFSVEPRVAGDIVECTNYSINESTEQTFGIYPNPVSSVLNISNTEGIDQITISNILGETISNYSVSGNTSSINVAKLQSGIYFVTFIKDNAISGTRKFIKQ